MTFTRPIFWRQGSFLEPQHFQLLEARWREDLGFALSSLFPWPWGVSALRINEEALSSFTLEILELDLFLPWGQRLLYPENLTLQSRSFRKAWANADEILEVSLAVPAFSAAGANVALPPEGDAGAPAAFPSKLYAPLPEPEAVPDLLAGGATGQVETLTHNGYLLFGDEGKESPGLSVTPLARLARDGERVKRAPYAPPALRLYAENPLREVMVDVLEILRAKGRQLEEYKITPAQSRLESLAANSLALVTALGAVCRSVARMTLLLSLPALHPFRAFAALRELIAELSIFSPGLSALGEKIGESEGKGYAVYNHLDPLPGFRESRETIARLLDGLSPGPELSLAFTQDGRRFNLKLPGWLDNGYVCWLSARSGAPLEEIRQGISAYAKLASPERLPSLISYNLPGVGLRPLREVPVGLPREAGAAYFAIRQKDPLWEEALKVGGLALFWDGAPEGTQITLTGNRL
ncbi:MAG: type VI secretion system baseplate subunit TssK [Deltaproteobacteria bacterium]|jgi:type VI secretion system protein ImpJ|nr:type VI secretion system baseplate subunit TssK [Deltaproteobacteria bacterium]